MADPIEEAARHLRHAKSALFITGAGISADSGLPTYRGIGGLYNTDTTEDGMPIEVALAGQTMISDPALCWKYIAQVEAAGRAATPNEGHEVIAKLEERLDRVLVLTQNVDGLHFKAGSTDVIEIHGGVRELSCTKCDHQEARENYAGMEIPPKCPRCDAIVRPDVILFGEMLDSFKVQRLIAEVQRGFDVVFSIGTTSVFPYIARPFLDAAARGNQAIEINPSETEVSDAATIRIETGAAAAMSAIWEHL